MRGGMKSRRRDRIGSRRRFVYDGIIDERGRMGDITHCLSIREPFASAIVARDKTIEWRSRKLIARTPETIAVATSKVGAGDYLPGGCIVGIARITAIVPWRDTESFYARACMFDAWDDYRRRKLNQLKAGGMGGYAMMISGFAACEPVPVRGNVGLYSAPDGFAPTYATEPDQMREWWGDARVWRDGPKDEAEAGLMDAMIEFGIGWRIDD